MARKPNYRFERMERERVKAAKKAARAQAKADRKAAKTTDEGVPADEGGEAASTEGSPETPGEATSREP